MQEVALISGGASGIGLETAKRLRNNNVEVWIGDVQDELGADVAAQIGAHYVHLDVSKKEDWDAAIHEINHVHGRLTKLVNNAGIADAGDLENETPLGFMRTIEVNLLGVFLGCQAGAKLIQASGGGAIVNVSSIFGLVGDQAALAYCASKGGVRSMTKAIALGLAEQQSNIRVNSIHPGFAATPLVANAVGALDEATAAEYMARTVGRTPLGLAQPEQIAGAIVFLLSDDAAHMTGSELVIDGGFTAA